MTLIAVLIATGLLGFLPLGIILFRKAHARNSRANGVRTPARIYNVYHTASTRKMTVYYTYYGVDQRQYYGTFSTMEIWKYKVNEVIDVYCDPSNPQYSTVDGAWESPALVIFWAIIAMVTLYAVYDIYLDVQGGTM